MASKWTDVTADKDYQALPDQEKRKVQDRYWSNVISQDKSFKVLKSEEQERLKNRFYGTPQTDIGFPSEKIIRSAIPSAVSPDLADPSKINKTLTTPVDMAGGVSKASGDMAEKAVKSAPVQGAMTAVSERPELQPLQAKNPIPQPSTMGEVPGAAVKSGLETLAAPIRAGATLQAPQMVAQQMTTDGLLKKGVNPYIAYAAGIVAGAAADPMSLATIAEIGASYGEGMAKSLSSRMNLKQEMVQMDVGQATAAAAYMKDADAFHQEAVIRRQQQIQALSELPPATGSSDPTQFKDIAIPQGEPRDVTLRMTSGPEVPQYVPHSTGVNVPKAGIEKSMTSRPRTRDLTGMEEIKSPVGGKISYEQAKLMPKESRLKVPEGYEPTRPETREIPKTSGSAPEIKKAGGVYGEKVASPETAHLPHNESYSWYYQTPPDSNGIPKKFGEWVNRSVKEMDDLRLAQDLAGPTGDRTADLWGTIRRYVGHQEVARFDAEHMMYEFADYIPDSDRRNLIFLYNDLGRAPTKEDLNILMEASRNAKTKSVKRWGESIERLLQQNLNLEPQEKSAAEGANHYMRNMGASAQSFKLAEETPEKALIPRLREKYGGPHLYVAKEEAEKGLFQRIITGKTRFAKPREYDNVVEAAKNGWLPKTIDQAELLGIYHNGVNRAASQKYLMNVMEKMGLINYEGEGNAIKGFAPKSRMLEKNIEGEVQKTMYAKTPYSRFPEVQRTMRNIAEDEWSLYDNSWYPAMESLTRKAKTFNLYLQTFHVKALGAEAFAKGFSPGKFREGLDLIDKSPDMVRSWIRNGLIINDAKDIGKEFTREMSGSWSGKNPVAMAGKVGDIYTDWVFRKYMTGLKVWNSNLVIDRLTRMGVTPERAVTLAVEDSNKIFGGLNIKAMARSEQLQRLMRTIFYAPDWKESRYLQMASFFGKGFAPDASLTEKAALTSMARSYWTNMAALVTVTHIADQVNPFKRMMSIDLANESGFKDVKKLAQMAELNMVYFTSSFALPLRTLFTMADPHLRYEARLKRVAESVLPIAAQKAINEGGGI